MSKVWCNLKAYVVVENPILLEMPDDLTEEEKALVAEEVFRDSVCEAFFIDWESWEEEDSSEIEFKPAKEDEDSSFVEYVVKRNEDGTVRVVEGGDE